MFLQILEGHEYKPFAYYSRSVLRINVTDMANYTCYAINQMIGGRQSVDQESFMVYVQSEGKKKKSFKSLSDSSVLVFRIRITFCCVGLKPPF